MRDEVLAKATTIKTLKISPSLNKEELKLKLKQLVELSTKNLKVKVLMSINENVKD